MATIKEARTALEGFKSCLRLEVMPSLEKLEISEPRMLDDIWAKQDYFPGSENGDWNPGVYFMLNAAGEIIYVGKASNNNAIGVRLSGYFKTDLTDKLTWRLSAHGKHKFKDCNPPAAISAIVISDYEFAWIAPAMEEYLINKLDPVANTVGKRKIDDG